MIYVCDTVGLCHSAKSWTMSSSTAWLYLLL